MSQRFSDQPAIPDLQKERETFVRTFLKKGVEFAEELIKENQEIRQELAQLKEDNARLRAHLASEDAIRELLTTVEALEQERNRLLARSQELERSTYEHEGRYHEIERELNDLASLHVASNQLHGTLSLPRVVRHICELCHQLIGAHRFMFYVLREDGETLIPIATGGIAPEDVKNQTVGEGIIGETLLAGTVRMRNRDKNDGTVDDPLAIVPLMADGQPVGALTIIELLEHKSRWASVDEELFRLLGSQASTALIAANLYGDKKDPRLALRGIAQKLEPGVGEPVSSRETGT